MHEYSIVRSLLDRIESEAQARGASAVHRVRVQLGELSGVESDLLASAFAMCRERTICERAELDIEKVAVRWACSGCDRPIAAGDVLQCPDCARPARLSGGDEIILERIEMEVP